MVLKKFENDSARWAETGDKSSVPSELSLAKIATGFVSGENADQPHVEDYNLLFNRLDKQVDTIIEEGTGSWYTDSTDANLDLTTGLWTQPWASTDATLNTIDGTGKYFVDAKVIFNSSNEPRLLLFDVTSGEIEVWDPRAMSLESSSSDLTSDLPALGTEVWELQSMCTDGTNLFGLFSDTDASPREHRIQAWDISTWNVTSGWAATGTAPSGTGAAGDRISRIIIADTTNLAVGCSWITITAAGDASVQLFLRSDGTAVRDGSGDSPTGVSGFIEDICSDGTNIFMAVKETGGPPKVHLCSATIADLTTGCGGSNFPFAQTTSTTAINGVMVQCGSNMGVIAYSHGSSPTEDDIVLRTFNSTDAKLDRIAAGRTSDSTPSINIVALFGDARNIIFDGFNIWLIGERNYNERAALCKIDVGKFALTENASQELRFDDLSPSIFIVDPSSETISIGTNLRVPLVFDGRDIWTMADWASGENIFRLPHALMRH